MRVRGVVLGVFALFGMIVPQLAGAEDIPMCHLFIESAGWIGDVKDVVKSTFSSDDNFCQKHFPSYPCFSYFETKADCNALGEDLVDHFVGEATDAGLIVQ
jgi:hypothetical protein